MHPRIEWGGSEAVALETVRALRPDHDVTLLTAAAPPLAELNDHYGLDLRPQDLRIENASMPAQVRTSHGFARLRGAFVEAAARRMAPRYDAIVSAYNSIETGRPALQLLADFSFVPSLRQAFDGAARPASTLRRAVHGLVDVPYRALSAAINPRSNASAANHLWAANSRWAQRVLKDSLGVDAELLYPPVDVPASKVPWTKRRIGFVLLGRVSPEKRVLEIIDLVERVHRGRSAPSLLIVGPAGDDRYAARVRSRVQEAGGWVEWVGRVDRDEKVRLLHQHRFGISGRPFEPFGMAVAEMVQAGLVPLVPAGGGQVEVVDEPILTYATPEEAEVRIRHLVDDSSAHEDLRARLKDDGERFRPAQFHRGVRKLVARAMERMAVAS